MRIVAICGSLQAKSGNRALLELAVHIAPRGVEVVIFEGLRALPHFDPDLEARGTPESVLELRRVLGASDGLLIASPEYGHSLPGVLKNMVDWLIGSGELYQRVVAITASTPGPDRGLRGLGALRDTLNAVSAVVVGGRPIARGPNAEPELAALLDALVEAVGGQQAERAAES